MNYCHILFQAIWMHCALKSPVIIPNSPKLRPNKVKELFQIFTSSKQWNVIITYKIIVRAEGHYPCKVLEGCHVCGKWWITYNFACCLPSSLGSGSKYILLLASSCWFMVAETVTLLWLTKHTEPLLVCFWLTKTQMHLGSFLSQFWKLSTC